MCCRFVGQTSEAVMTFNQNIVTTLSRLIYARTQAPIVNVHAMILAISELMISTFNNKIAVNAVMLKAMII
jgi:hypothetical protein